MPLATEATPPLDIEGVLAPDAPEAPAVVDAEAEPGAVDWGTIATESNIPDEEIDASSIVDAVVVPPAKAISGAAFAPPGVPPAPVAAPVQAVAPVSPPAPQVDSTPAPVVPTTPVTPIDHAKQREDYVEQLAQSYAMTEEEGVELLQSPETVLPRMAAQLQVNIAEQVIQQISQMLPQFMEGHLGQKQADTDNQNAFFEAWPDLNKPDNMETLTRIAVGYRRQNPAVPRDKAIKEIGAIASIALGVVPAGMSAPVTPTVPVVPAGFRPALPGGGRPPVPQETNEFAKLNAEWIDE